MAIDRLTFVYDADGTLVGEVRYWVGTLFGADHCSLCDITHHRFGKRRDYQRCAERIGLPVTYLHRDDLDGRLAETVEGRLPCVVGHCGDHDVVLLDGESLSSLGGDVDAFERSLRSAIGAAAVGPA